MYVGHNTVSFAMFSSEPSQSMCMYVSKKWDLFTVYKLFINIDIGRSGNWVSNVIPNQYYAIHSIT